MMSFVTTHARRWRRGIAIIGAIVVLAAAGWVTRERILIGMARLLTVDDAEEPADYLLVLGGDAENRPFEAADLYRRGFAPTILIFEHKIGTIASLDLEPSHDELYRRVLIAGHVRPQDIQVLPGIVDSTRDEARSARRFLSSHRARRLIVVTSPEHTRRARWIFRHELRGEAIDVRVAPARRLDVDETNWWKDDESSLAYVHEYLKLPYWRIESLVH